MRIAVVEAGGVGGGYGRRCQGGRRRHLHRPRRASCGDDRQGIKVESGRGDTHLVPTQANDDPKTVGPVDVVLFCVKLWDVGSAGAAIKPMVAADTGSFRCRTASMPRTAGADPGQDGCDGRRRNISATIAEPGVIRQTGTVMRMVFRRARRRKSARAEAFAVLCGKAGIDGVCRPRS